MNSNKLNFANNRKKILLPLDRIFKKPSVMIRRTFRLQSQSCTHCLLILEHSKDKSAPF